MDGSLSGVDEEVLYETLTQLPLLQKLDTNLDKDSHRHAVNSAYKRFYSSIFTETWKNTDYDRSMLVVHDAVGVRYSGNTLGPYQNFPDFIVTGRLICSPLVSLFRYRP